MLKAIEAGFPAGVVNLVTCSRNVAEILLVDPRIGGISFVGSTSAFGCAGMRCMALLVVCVEETVADEFVQILVGMAKQRKIGCAYGPNTELGPVVSEDHKRFVTD